MRDGRLCFNVFSSREGYIYINVNNLPSYILPWLCKFFFISGLFTAACSQLYFKNPTTTEKKIKPCRNQKDREKVLILFNFNIRPVSFLSG